MFHKHHRFEEVAESRNKIIDSCANGASAHDLQPVDQTPGAQLCSPATGAGPAPSTRKASVSDVKSAACIGCGAVCTIISAVTADSGYQESLTLSPPPLPIGGKTGPEEEFGDVVKIIRIGSPENAVPGFSFREPSSLPVPGSLRP